MSDYIDRNVRLVALDGRVRERILKDNPSKHGDLLRRRCRKCGNDRLGLGGYLQRDGRIAVRMYCADCFRVQTTDLKVPDEIRNIVGIACGNVGKPCQVHGCGDVYSQRHHILPWCIDSEMAWRYPTVYLCVYHHRLWHEKTGIGVSEWR